MISVLTRVFGVDHLELAEDVAQDSLIEAMSKWQYEGVPENPSAWLFKVAKNKALNIINREKYKREYLSDVAYNSEWAIEPDLNHLFSEQEIQDDQLRMIFTCCHPSISSDSQIAIALKTLCGFSIPEIAKAFFTTEENINKRLVRARQKIRASKNLFEVLEGKELEKRLNAVLETIYLLFNEGYSASVGNDIIRYDLCEEAIRIAQIILANEAIKQKGNVFALLSLMLLNSSRFKARQDSGGNLLTMAEQDRSLWDKKMKELGLTFLNEAAKDSKIGVYHIMAAISAQHSVAKDFETTNWKVILSLYDHLSQIDKSPLVLLNRAIVVLKVHGAESALDELSKIEHIPSLRSYHLLYSTKAEFFIELDRYPEAADNLINAIRLSTIAAEKDLLQKKLDSCNQKII